MTKVVPSEWQEASETGTHPAVAPDHHGFPHGLRSGFPRQAGHPLHTSCGVFSGVSPLLWPQCPPPRHTAASWLPDPQCHAVPSPPSWPLNTVRVWWPQVLPPATESMLTLGSSHFLSFLPPSSQTPALDIVLVLSRSPVLPSPPPGRPPGFPGLGPRQVQVE